MDLTRLLKAIEERDNEVVHSAYDDLIFEIAEKHEPETVAKLKKLVKNVGFWYA